MYVIHVSMYILKGHMDYNCFLVLYMDDIWLVTNDKDMLYDVKQFFWKKISMKDMRYLMSLSLRSIWKKNLGVMGLS